MFATFVKSLFAFKARPPPSSQSPENPFLFQKDYGLSPRTPHAYLDAVADLCSSTGHNVSLQNVVTKLEYSYSLTPVREEILSAHVAFIDAGVVHPAYHTVVNFPIRIPELTPPPTRASHGVISRKKRRSFSSISSMLHHPGLLSYLKSFSSPLASSTYQEGLYSANSLRIYPMDNTSWRHGLPHVADLTFLVPEQSRFSLEQLVCLVDFAVNTTTADSKGSPEGYLPTAWVWNAVAEMSASHVVESRGVDAEGRRDLPGQQRRKSMVTKVGKPPCRFDSISVTPETIADFGHIWKRWESEFESKSKEKSLAEERAREEANTQLNRIQEARALADQAEAAKRESQQRYSQLLKLESHL
ncbi:hypothetical protein BDZ89DRAFT_1134351 [Hymenopellis radicata]|nr:hypothetical protein BDZ89DRAFT_1134351 [Hymenopellis radicata]